MLVVFIIGKLILYVDEYHNGSRDTNGKPKQIKQRKKFVTDSISDQRKQVILKK
jgi:hypothetical protein